jgi:mRNA interferase RelE/StbE
MSEPYEIELPEQAAKSLGKLRNPMAQRIENKLLWLANHVEDTSQKALTGDWAGYFRVRVGDYRIIYRVDHEERLIFVAKLGHRSTIYD